MITAERLRELMDYNSATGALVWKRRGNPSWDARYAGTDAGSLNADGYVYIKVEGQHYKAHRLAWLHFHGEFPAGELDHKDNVRDHNWIENLRPATRPQNAANQRRKSNNRSGFKGACWHSRRKKWQARCKQAHLGYFDSPEQAHAAYAAAAAQHFGEFARVE